MSQWTDRVRQHGVWQQLGSLGSAIDQSLERDGVDALAMEGLERLRAVLTFAGKRLGGADPQLIDPGSLNTLSGALQQAVVELELFVADGDVTHIANANLNADSILAGLPAINYSFVADDWIALSDAARAYRNDMEQNLRAAHQAVSQFRADSEDVGKRLSQLSGDVETERVKLNSIGAEIQSQFATAQETRKSEFAEQIQTALAKIQAESASLQQRLSELGTEIGTERGRITTIAAEFQSQFSVAQESRNREFAEVQTTRQDKFGGLIADYNQRLADQNAEFSTQRSEAFQRYEKDVSELTEKYGESAKLILDQIEKHKTAVEKLVGVIGNLGVTSGYLKAANEARRLLWMWQALTVTALGFLVVIAWKAFLPSVQGTFSWESFAGRVFVTLTVGVFAGYAGSQAERYTQVERRNRKLALELEAIGPYLAPLPVEKQEAFRLELGERSFGGDDASLAPKSGKGPTSVVDLMKSKELRDFVIDVVKAAAKKTG
jgi:hypothetical protein